MNNSVQFTRLPHEEWADSRGLKVAEPMFELTINNQGIRLKRVGNEVYFRDLISGMFDCLEGRAKATILTEIAGDEIVPAQTT